MSRQASKGVGLELVALAIAFESACLRINTDESPKRFMGAFGQLDPAVPEAGLPFHSQYIFVVLFFQSFQF